MINQNEQSLLKYISCVKEAEIKENGILNTALKLGIEIKFQDFNSIYQIIDELNFKSLKRDLIRK